MTTQFIHKGKMYYGRNSRDIGGCGTPVDATGLQPECKTPRVAYQATNWGCLEDVEGNRRRAEAERLARAAHIAARKKEDEKNSFSYKLKRFFGIR